MRPRRHSRRSRGQPHWSGAVRGRDVRGDPERRRRCRSACATTGRATSCAISTDRPPTSSPTATRARPDGSSFVLLEAINGPCAGRARGRGRVRPARGPLERERASRSGRTRRRTTPTIGWARRVATGLAPSSLPGRRLRQLRLVRRDRRAGAGGLRRRSGSPGCRPSSAATTPTTSSGSTSTCRQVRQLRDRVPVREAARSLAVGLVDGLVGRHGRESRARRRRAPRAAGRGAGRRRGAGRSGR